MMCIQTLNTQKNISYNGTYVLNINNLIERLQMTTKSLLFLIIIFNITSNLTFSMNKNKETEKPISISSNGILIDRRNKNGGYMIPDRNSANSMSYSPEDRATFLEAYEDYCEKHMSPREKLSSTK
jgi:hypothetical protein